MLPALLTLLILAALARTLVCTADALMETVSGIDCAAIYAAVALWMAGRALAWSLVPVAAVWGV